MENKANHEDGDGSGMKKKKTRRGGRARHPMLDQDTKIVSKNQDKKRDLAHIKCFECGDMGHFASWCPTKLEKKAQATHERQGNEKQQMSKQEKAQSKRSCYLCRERGHMVNSCPLGNTPKPISIDDCWRFLASPLGLVFPSNGTKNAVMIFLNTCRNIP